MTDVTARLEDWDIQTFKGNPEYMLWGRIFDDVRDRWEDGQLIHTSGISSKKFPPAHLKKGDIVRTRNSVYKLGKKSEYIK